MVALKSELDIEVPEYIIEEARRIGSIAAPKYVYRDGEYGDRLPAASLGCETPTHFRSPESAMQNKEYLSDGWVVFWSPSAGEKKVRSPGKGLCEPCLVCGENRISEGAHFPTPARHGGTDMIPLCPTHHRLLDNGILSMSEWNEIKKKYPQFVLVSDLIEWAHSKGHPYTREDTLNKKVYENYNYRKRDYDVDNSVD